MLTHKQQQKQQSNTGLPGPLILVISVERTVKRQSSMEEKQNLS